LIRIANFRILTRPVWSLFIAAWHVPRDLRRDVTLVVVGRLDALVPVEDAKACLLDAVLCVIAVGKRGETLVATEKLCKVALVNRRWMLLNQPKFWPALPPESGSAGRPGSGSLL
jgi:hypothetical protein